MAVFSPSVFSPVSRPRAITVTLPTLRLPRLGGPALLAVGLVAAFLVTLVISTLAGPAGAGSASPVRATSGAVVAESAAYPAWTIRAGDTLWTIADEVAPQADPRAVVLQLQVLNGLQSDDILQPGMVLQLPRD